MIGSTLMLNLLANALFVVLMVPIVLLLCRVFKNPHVHHGLWALVLLKFLTPPILDLPVPPWTEPERIDERQERLIALQSLGIVPSIASESAEPSAAAEQGAFWLSWLDVEHWRGWVMPALLGLWGCGSLAWFGLCLTRALRFQRFLRLAPLADPDQQRELQRLGERLGVQRIPEMRLTDQPLPPLLWVVPGYRVLLIPRPLLALLTAEQREALLAHELAHLQRKDHWFRLLEALVLGLFWWHPCAWLARNRLQHAEEQCCDAWVLGEYPDRSRSYASALLETVDFLAESRRHLPVAASGFGQVNVLRSRFEMILANSLPRRLSWSMRLAILLVAACLLPIAPGLAKADDEQAQRKKERQARIQKLINELKKELDEADQEDKGTIILESRFLETQDESGVLLLGMVPNVRVVPTEPGGMVSITAAAKHKAQDAPITIVGNVIMNQQSATAVKGQDRINWLVTTHADGGSTGPIKAFITSDWIELGDERVVFGKPTVITVQSTEGGEKRTMRMKAVTAPKEDQPKVNEGVIELFIVPQTKPPTSAAPKPTDGSRILYEDVLIRLSDENGKLIEKRLNPKNVKVDVKIDKD